MHEGCTHAEQHVRVLDGSVRGHLLYEDAKLAKVVVRAVILTPAGASARDSSAEEHTRQYVQTCGDRAVRTGPLQRKRSDTARRLAQTRGKRTLVGTLQGEEIVAEDPLAGLGDLEVEVGVLAERDACG
jgi:hypothetical protein